VWQAATALEAKEGTPSPSPSIPDAPAGKLDVALFPRACDSRSCTISASMQQNAQTNNSRKADARTRTGDPFITRERQVGNVRPL